MTINHFKNEWQNFYISSRYEDKIMAVTLKKGEGVSLKKQEHDLSIVTIGLGWDVKEKKTGFLKSLFGKNEEEYDLDVIAFLCDASGKIANCGEVRNGSPSLLNGDIVFYNSMRHPSGNVWLTGDNRTGEGDGDDEQIILKLNALGNEYQKIVFIVQIYDGKRRQQQFGEVANAFIRAVDANDKEMVRFNLSNNPSFDQKYSMVFAELVREADGWKFKAIGNPSIADSFVTHIESYL